MLRCGVVQSPLFRLRQAAIRENRANASNWWYLPSAQRTRIRAIFLSTPTQVQARPQDPLPKPPLRIAAVVPDPIIPSSHQTSPVLTFQICIWTNNSKNKKALFIKRIALCSCSLIRVWVLQFCCRRLHNRKGDVSGACVTSEFR